MRPAHDDVETIRQMDPSDSAAVAAILTDDCVYHEDPHWLDGRTVSGRDAVKEVLEEYVEVWGTRSQTVEWAEPAGAAVVAGIRQRGETPQGGMPIDQLWTYVFRMRGGAVAELWAFADEAEGRRKAAEVGGEGSGPTPDPR